MSHIREYVEGVTKTLGEHLQEENRYFKGFCRPRLDIGLPCLHFSFIRKFLIRTFFGPGRWLTE